MENKSKTFQGSTEPDDIPFTIHAILGESKLFVEIKAYAITGVEVSSGVLSYEKNEANNGTGDPWTSDLAEAQVFLEGSVKWGGCSNLYFPDSCYHFCDQASAIQVGALLGRVYEIAAELMPGQEMVLG